MNKKDTQSAATMVYEMSMNRLQRLIESKNESISLDKQLIGV